MSIGSGVGRRALCLPAALHYAVAMTTNFSGKTVIVTGASAGVGEATALAFARQGANVVLVARREGPLQAVADSIGTQGKGQALTVAMDVCDVDACSALLERCRETFGGVHVLVNNAGYHKRGPVEDNEADNLGTIIDVNLRAPIVLTRLALPYLRDAGSGAVVNVASLAGCTPVPGAASYSASKFGLRAFSLALAEELRGSGINIGVVSPGPIDTAFIMAEIDEVTDLTFSQPMSTAEQVADAIVAVAASKRQEIKMPAASGVLTTVAYLFPSLGRALRPMLERKGRKAKDFYRQRAKDGGQG